MNKTNSGTRRAALTRRKNATHNSQYDQNCDAEKRLKRLEALVKELQHQVWSLRDPRESATDWLVDLEVKGKRGPKSKAPGFIHSLRNDQVRLLEEYWPELFRLCTAKDGLVSLHHALTQIAERSSYHANAAKHLLRNFDVLRRFIAGDRFRNDHRQIANAMAGVPAISFWRSLKLCGEKPCDLQIGERAIKAYIQRKHPELYRMLEYQSDLVSIARVMRAYRTKDSNIAWFRNAPIALEQAWKAANEKRI